MWKPKSFLALSVIALALSACGKSSDSSGTVVYGGGVATTNYSNFAAYCASSGGVMLSGLSSAGTPVCDLPRAELGGVSLVQWTLGGSVFSTQLAVNEGDTIKVANPSSGMIFYVAGVAAQSPGIVGTDLIFQAPASGVIQYGVGAGFKSYGFDGITVQTCFDQNNAVYACP